MGAPLRERHDLGLRRVVVAMAAVSASALLAACTSAPRVGARSEAVVYGADDRLEVYELPAGPLRHRAEQSIAVQLDESALDESDPTNVVLTYAQTLGEAKNLCAGERFADQPEPGTCSGTLIDAQHILTAGHCMESASDCGGSTIWALGLRYDAPGHLATMTADDVYRCARVLAYFDDGMVDHSVVELDRPVVGHEPAPIAAAPPALGSALTLMGYPNGIPLKVASGGAVTWLSGDASYGTGTVDAFAGNSGSGIFNDAGELVAILDRGSRDYMRVGGCRVVNVIDPPPTDDGEGFTVGATALHDYCYAPGVESPICDCAGPCTPSAAADRCADAERIAATSQVIHGDLVAHGDFARGSCGGAGFDHFYRFTLTETTTLVAQVDGFDSVLYLRAGCSGSELACNDDIVADTNTGSRIERPLGPGDYVLVVDGYAPGEDSYTLTLDFGGAGADAGVDGGAADAGVDAGVDGAVDDAGVGGDGAVADAGAGDDGGAIPSSDGGCSVSVGTQRAPGATLWLGVLGALVVCRRRRWRVSR